jgi:hypothetical protein
MKLISFAFILHDIFCIVQNSCYMPHTTMRIHYFQCHGVFTSCEDRWCFRFVDVHPLSYDNEDMHYVLPQVFSSAFAVTLE